MTNYNYYPQVGANPYGMYYQQQQFQQPVVQQQLNGKLVDSIDVVRAAEIPFNSYGVYPQADGSCIYLKEWTPSGTTRIVTYVPKQETTPEPKVTLEEIQKAIIEINDKLNDIMPKQNTPKGSPMTKVKKDE